MKKLVYFLVGLIFALTLYSFINSDILGKIGCTDNEAKNTIFDNFYFGNINTPYCNNKFKLIPANEIETVIGQLFIYIKNYTKSDEFKSKFLTEHLNSKPKEPLKKVIENPNAQVQEAVKQLEQQLNNPNLTEQQKNDLKTSIDAMKQTYNNPETNNILSDAYSQQINEADSEYKVSLTKYKTDLISWEKDTVINDLISKQLKQFINLTSTIDFNAKTIKIKNITKFENPNYEAKNNEWKKCFRVGKVGITYARKCANEWLKEIDKN